MKIRSTLAALLLGGVLTTGAALTADAATTGSLSAFCAQQSVMNFTTPGLGGFGNFQSQSNAELVPYLGYYQAYVNWLEAGIQLAPSSAVAAPLQTLVSALSANMATLHSMIEVDLGYSLHEIPLAAAESRYNSLNAQLGQESVKAGAAETNNTSDAVCNGI